MIRLVVGLGNPEAEGYKDTRHNVGQSVIKILGTVYAEHFEDFGDFVLNKNFRAYLASGKIGGEKVLLMYLAVYMNESGGPVQKVASFWKIEPKDILVVFDDKEIPLGKLRIRMNGSAGGHNGMRSIIERLGTKDIPRLRVGTGTARSARADAARFVLGKFSPAERKAIKEAEKRAAEAVETALKEGLTAAMNKYNE